MNAVHVSVNDAHPAQPKQPYLPLGELATACRRLTQPPDRSAANLQPVPYPTVGVSPETRRNLPNLPEPDRTLPDPTWQHAPNARRHSLRLPLPDAHSYCGRAELATAAANSKGTERQLGVSPI